MTNQRDAAEVVAKAQEANTAIEQEPVAWRYKFKAEHAHMSRGSNGWVLANQDPAESRVSAWRNLRIIEPLYDHPAPSDQEKLLIGDLADALEDARNNGFGEEFFRIHVDQLLTRARQTGES